MSRYRRGAHWAASDRQAACRAWGLAVSDDNPRRNALALDGDVVLTIDLVGLRLRPCELMAQVLAAHAWLNGVRGRSA